MKKKYLLMPLSFLSINMFPNFADAQGTRENSSIASPTTQSTSLVLPPIRRIGLDMVETNIDEFRSFMRDQDRLLHGIVALPFNEQDMSKTLAADFEKQTKNTGRFWDLSFTQFLNILPMNDGKVIKKSSDKRIENLKLKLELDYNLDAWLKPIVVFSPDQTLVRVTLKGISSPNSTWAREDILLEAQAKEEQISRAFSEAISRIVSTIGHDGRVTYSRDNLMTVDFGTERGLVRGQKLIAGYVILKSFHPQSGEFLRAERIPLYELKVLEARKGSSLCQITAIDKLMLEQVTSTFHASLPILLSWRAEKGENKIGWREPYDPQTAPILGAVESGFGVPIEKKSLPELPHNMMEEPPETQKKLAVARAPKQEMPAFSQENTANSTNKIYLQKRSHYNSPRSWDVQEMKVGSGVVLGSFAEGEATSFPVTLLNRLNTSAFIKVDSSYDLYLAPQLQFAFYNGNSLTGQSYFLNTTLYNAAWSDKTQGQNIYLGGGVEATGGGISSNGSNYSLSSLSLNPSIKWESNISGFGDYNIVTSISALDIIKGQSVWSIKGEIHPFALMTKQIAFDVGLKRYVKDWIEFSVGATWDFEQNN